MRRLLGLTMAAACTLALAQTPTPKQAVPPNPAQTVRVESPAAMQSLSRAAADEFTKTRKGGVIQAGLSGTASALQKLCRGEIDIAGATRPMQKAELEACGKGQVEFIELPVAFDAVTVIVNPRNAFVKAISVEELRKIWQASSQDSTTQWNEVNAAWPKSPLTLLGPDALSDEGHYFNEAILGHGAVARKDIMSSGEDAVLAQGVARSVHTLSYVSLEYYLKNRATLRAVPVAAANGGAAVAPSVEAITKGAYQPLARPLFYYISVKSLARPEVKSYVEFLTTDAGRLARNVNLAPLSDAAYRRDLERVRTLVKGSAWEGAIPVGLTIEALQKKYGVL